MKFYVVILFLFVLAVGGYFLADRHIDMKNLSAYKQECLNRYANVPEGQKMVDDIEGFCACQSSIDPRSSKDDMKAVWKSCNDQYIKPNLVKTCMDANVSINPAGEAGKGVNCQCFYDNLINAMADQSQDMPAERRNQLSAQAFMACRQ